MERFNRMSLVAAVLAVSAAVAAVPVFAGVNIHVVHPGESIQAAVDAAAPGDTVIVRAGEYYESIIIHTDALTLQAQGHVLLEPSHYGSSACYQAGHDVGICVVPVDLDPASGSYANRVRNVTITGFHIEGFEGDGVYGFGTEKLTVSNVVAIDNTSYGVASFEGIGTTFTHNTVSGSHDAGIYIGDSPDARAVVRHNRSHNNALGILVRHSHNALVFDNESMENCIGVFLLADGQAGGSGDITVLNNSVVANNDVCTQFAAEEFLPILGGGGIVLAGSQHNVVIQNLVKDNQGNTLFSGGIVLIATPRANRDGSFDASTNNIVVLNRLRGNEPGNIVHDSASVPNLIVGNR